MNSKFSEFLEEIEAEARAEGPAAVAELAAFDERYRLAHQLMTRRRELGMTQAHLASLTGIGQADISRIESGRANPTLGTLSAIAHSLCFRLGFIPIASKPATGSGPAGSTRRTPVPA